MADKRRDDYGKASPGEMKGAVYGNLGKARNEVLVGPGRGLDNAVVSLPGGRVMVVTTDPISMIPNLGARLSAWLSVHLLASDLASSGADPEFATFSYNFPAAMASADRKEYLRAMGDECTKLGVSIVAGNTGTYPGSGFSVIGAGTMFGSAAAGGYVTPAMARAGDAVVVTKHAAIEAAATLAGSFPGFLAEEIGMEATRRAASLVRFCTTVEDARGARAAGLGREGVTSMHDATEGGVLGALDEMAEASGKAFVIDPLKIPVSTDARAVCRAFGLDPLRTMGEGALIITCAPPMISVLEKSLAKRGIPTAEVGRVARGRGLWLVKNGRKEPAASLGRDPFWRAYESAAKRGLK